MLLLKYTCENTKHVRLIIYNAQIFFFSDLLCTNFEKNEIDWSRVFIFLLPKNPKFKAKLWRSILPNTKNRLLLRFIPRIVLRKSCAFHRFQPISTSAIAFSHTYLCSLVFKNIITNTKRNYLYFLAVEFWFNGNLIK